MDGLYKLIILTLIISLIYKGDAWDYKHSKDWDKGYPTCGKGKNQSPINLRADFIQANNGEPSFQLLDYTSNSHKIVIRNTGTTVELSGTWPDVKPAINSSVLFPNETYTLNNTRVYWGRADNNGTHHSIEGNKYSMELHLVHYNGKYENLTDISNYTDAVVIISVLYHVNDSATSNLGMLGLSVLVESVLSPEKIVEYDAFNFSTFLPDPIGSFYFYNGSDVAPPCSENIRWIVIAEPQPIVSDVVYAFRSVKLNMDDTPNIRPLQSANDRVVQYYDE